MSFWRRDLCLIAVATGVFLSRIHVARAGAVGRRKMRSAKCANWFALMVKPVAIGEPGCGLISLDLVIRSIPHRATSQVA